MTQHQTRGRRGIHIRHYCAEHESFVKDRLERGSADKELLRRHALKITWLQHERLVHLIVLMLAAILFLFSIGLFIVLTNPLVLVLVAVSFALLAAYIRHYFFLENTVQLWYVLYDTLYTATKNE